MNWISWSANFSTFIIKAHKNTKTQEYKIYKFSINKAWSMILNFHKSPKAEKFFILPDWSTCDLAKQKSQSQTVAATYAQSPWHRSTSSYRLKIGNIQTVRGMGEVQTTDDGGAVAAEWSLTTCYVLLTNSKAGNSEDKCKYHQGPTWFQKTSMRRKTNVQQKPASID